MIRFYLDKKSRVVVVQSLVLNHIIYLVLGAPPPLLSLPRSKSFKILQQVVGGIKKFDHVSPAIESSSG